MDDPLLAESLPDPKVKVKHRDNEHQTSNRKLGMIGRLIYLQQEERKSVDEIGKVMLGVGMVFCRGCLLGDTPEGVA